MRVRIPAVAAGDFSSPESTLCADPYSVSPFHPRVTAVARERPRSFCQKCSWQTTHKHAYIFDPTKSQWADYATVQAYCGNLLGNELTRNSSGNTRSRSSQLAEPLWTDPGLKSGIIAHELISTFKKRRKEKRRRRMNRRTFSQIPRKRGKNHHQPPPSARTGGSFVAAKLVSHSCSCTSSVVA